MEQKANKAGAISEMIHSFCRKYLNEELEGYCMKLCDTLARKRKIDISRGRTEIWAAAVVYTVARLNFLFDRANRHYLTVDTICDFFNTKKTTTGNKASLIMDSCNLGIGAVGYCGRLITDALTYYKTPEGFIIPKSMMEDPEFLIRFAEGEEKEELQLKIEERKQLRMQKEQERKAHLAQEADKRRARLAEIRRKKAEEEYKRRDAEQLNLFE